MIPILGLLHAAASSAGASAMAPQPALLPTRPMRIEGSADGFAIIDSLAADSSRAARIQPVTLGSTVTLDAMLSVAAPVSANGGRP